MRGHMLNALQSKSSPIKKESNGKLPRTKKQSLKSTVKSNAWRAFSQYIRLRDCLRTTGTPDRGECFTCGVEKPFKELQAGHFRPGRHYSNLFSEEGVHAQCKQCNLWKYGNELEYRKAIIKLYGKRYDEILEKEAREIKKYSVEDLLNIAECYKMKYKELLNENLMQNLMQIRDS